MGKRFGENPPSVGLADGCEAEMRGNCRDQQNRWNPSRGEVFVEFDCNKIRANENDWWVDVFVLLGVPQKRGSHARKRVGPTQCADPHW